MANLVLQLLQSTRLLFIVRVQVLVVIFVILILILVVVIVVFVTILLVFLLLLLLITAQVTHQRTRQLLIVVRIVEEFLLQFSSHRRQTTMPFFNLFRAGQKIARFDYAILFELLQLWIENRIKLQLHLFARVGRMTLNRLLGCAHIHVQVLSASQTTRNQLLLCGSILESDLEVFRVQFTMNVFHLDRGKWITEVVLRNETGLLQIIHTLSIANTLLQFAAIALFPQTIVFLIRVIRVHFIKRQTRIIALGRAALRIKRLLTLVQVVRIKLIWIVMVRRNAQDLDNVLVAAIKQRRPSSQRILQFIRLALQCWRHLLLVVNQNPDTLEVIFRHPPLDLFLQRHCIRLQLIRQIVLVQNTRVHQVLLARSRLKRMRNLLRYSSFMQRVGRRLQFRRNIVLIKVWILIFLRTKTRRCFTLMQ
mmetsp:Transcript_25353/g.41308  ORF Transcript_25353/g.41308 Transcript_25353/m.41308 type:complete len:421 (-) Transcript_25353:510-1772(-)